MKPNRCGAAGRLALPLILFFSLSSVEVANAEEGQCHLDGTCGAEVDCRFLLARPKDGSWGIFAGKDIPAGSVLPLSDVEVPITDRQHYKALQKLLWNVTVPDTSLAFKEKDQPCEADSVELVSCKSNPSLEYLGCSEFNEPARIYPNVGATSSYQHCSYKAIEPIAAGASLLGNCLVTESTNEKQTTEWLSANGFCIDHLLALQHDVKQVERKFSKGDTVALAPVAALSREELVMVLADVQVPAVVHWKGHQLLLNYCYGHPSSSIVFFNYLTPGVLSMYSAGDEFPANVGVRWSSQTDNSEEFLTQDKEELLHNNGLVMEFYALTELTAEDQLVIDYGDAVRRAWDDHVGSWTQGALVHSNDYVSARKFAGDCDKELLISHQCMNKVPSWIEVWCAVDDPDTLETADSRWLNRMLEGTWKKWALSPENKSSFPCKILGLDTDETYRIQVQTTPTTPVEEGTKIRLAPRSSIRYMDKPYTGNQFLRRAFRHEIQLPEEMVPAPWRDLALDPDSKCGLYAAESAIPFSGLGMFTAKPIRKGERVFYGEIIINAEDVELNVRLRHWLDGEVYFNEKDWLLYNYYWDPSVAASYFDAMSIQTIIPGLGMLANSHTGLVNSQHKYPTRVTYLNRFRDPGAGCSTTYHDMHYNATHDIEAGAELYVAYGDEWFEERTNLGVIPLSYDFELADEAIDLITKIVNHTELESQDSEEELILDFLSMLKNVSSPRDRLAAAFPSDIPGFQKSADTGTADLTVPNRVRSIEWLEENGRCLDNIRPKKSTIKQAGQGAFATRRLKQGQVIAPMPLVHLRRRHMDIYDSSDQTYADPKAEIFRDGTQLLMNYCYGHPTSSLLLFPYSPVVNYINHNLTSPNAELRWSTLPTHNVDWLSRTPDSLDSEDHAGLVMELFALREIQPDEEIFINYGEAWDSGWHRYLNDWGPGPEGAVYASSEELNMNLEWIRTQKEKYPFANGEELVHICFVNITDPIQGRKGTYYWAGADDLFEMSEYAWPCEVEAIEEDARYTYLESWDRQNSAIPVDLKYSVIVELDDGEDRKAKIINVPRKAIRVIDTRYNSDNYQREGFRHSIHLPDHMIPPAWKDLLKKN